MAASLYRMTAVWENRVINYDGRKFEELMQELLQGADRPMQILFPALGHGIYFDPDVIQAILSEEIYLDEAIDKLVCDGLGRNVQDIDGIDGDIVEANSLWKRNGCRMTLLDKDRDISTEYNENNFRMM